MKVQLIFAGLALFLLGMLFQMTVKLTLYVKEESGKAIYYVDDGITCKQIDIVK
jgi:hypothetical protein